MRDWMIWRSSALLLAAGALATAAPAQTLRLLDLRSLDPVLLLPPPPPSGSADQRRELEEVRAAVASASAAERARAAYDDVHEDPAVFDAAIAPGVTLQRLPATWALLKQVQAEADAEATSAKTAFGRTRPWGEDRRLLPCQAAGARKPTRSYPSGHAMLGYSVGLVLSQLLPDRAPAILTRAREYARNRIICAEHYPSDLEASDALAAIVVTRLEALPDFQAGMETARAELRTAVAAPPSVSSRQR